MERFFVVSEEEFKRWVREAVQEGIATALCSQLPTDQKESLLNRKEIAGELRISLVTLTDWMKRGLPFHKQRGRVYFLRTEVMAYIKKYHFSKSLSMDA